MQRSPTFACRRLIALLAALYLCAANGCTWRDDSPTATAAPPSDLAQHLAGEAARSLNDRREFRFPAAMAPGEVPIISEERARELAWAWLQNWRAILQTPMERDHGGPIDWNSLRPGRAFFARTPYAPVPERYHPGLRHHLGPRYVILFHDGAEPVLVVSVAAYTTEARVDERGRMLTPVQHGGEVLVSALSPSPASGFGLQVNLPEQAVAQVGRATGARTARVPELMLRGDSTLFIFDPALAVWKVQLDRDVGVRRRANSTATVRVHELYVGPNGKVFIPRPTQPAEIQFVAPLRRAPTEQRVYEPMTLMALPPVLFDEVTLDQAGR